MIKIGVKIDLTGQQFGRWIVLEKSEEKRGSNRATFWKCQCSCNEKTIKYVSTNSLTSGKSKSCGCLAIELTKIRNKKYNTYDLSGEYGIGWTSNTNKEFYFDLEDYDKIKDICWNESTSTGYLSNKSRNKGLIVFHRLIMNIVDRNIQVDHIFHNKLDNRKSQLRVVTNQQNSCNKKVKGVWYDKSRCKWCTELNYKKKKYMKRFNTYEEALDYRKKLEKEHFGEFAYKEEGEEFEN